MHLNSSLGIPFTRIAPIFVGINEGILPLKSSAFKEFKRHLRFSYAQIASLKSNPTATIVTESLKNLQNDCCRTLEASRACQQPPKKSALLLQLGTFKTKLSPEETINALKEIKQKLIENLHTPEKDLLITTLNGRIDSQLAHFERIKKQTGTSLSEIESSHSLMLTETMRLRYNIDSYAYNPRLPKEQEELLLFRCKRVVNDQLLREGLEKLDKKEIKWRESFETLTTRWNKLAVDATEITGLHFAIDTIKPIIKELLNSKFKLNYANRQIEEMRAAYDSIESFFSDDGFDPTTHVPKAETTEILITKNKALVEAIRRERITGLKSNVDALSACLSTLKPHIEKALNTLDTALQKKDPIEENNQLFKHQTEVNTLFSDVHEKNVTLFKELKTQIETAFIDLRSGIEEAKISLNFLENNSPFAGELADSYLQHQDAAKKIRDERVNPKVTRVTYQEALDTAENHWDAFEASIPALAKRLTQVKDEFEKFMIKSTELIRATNIKPGDDQYIKPDALRSLQTMYQQKQENLSRYWKTKLEPINRTLTQELNRAVNAIESDNEDIKGAIVTEKRHLLTSALGSLIPEGIRNLTSSLDFRPSFVSPFDNLVNSK